MLRRMNSIKDDVELLTHPPDNGASSTGREIWKVPLGSDSSDKEQRQASV